MEAWRNVTDAVHAEESFIFAQLWMCGRAARPGAIKHGAEVVSASNIPANADSLVPRPLTEEEITEYIGLFRQAGLNALEAGFDGVEIHGANGYLLDQFTQDVSNQRTDQWGGSIENRARISIAIVAELIDAIGAERVGYRISPWSHHLGMGMADPVPQFAFLVAELNKLRLAYVHIIEARVEGNADASGTQSIDFLLEAWNNGTPIIVAGGYNPATARAAVDKWQQRGRDVAVAFGRSYISNPDLPLRIRDGLPIASHRRDLFYNILSPEGYTTYPTYAQERQTKRKEAVCQRTCDGSKATI